MFEDRKESQTMTSTKPASARCALTQDNVPVYNAEIGRTSLFFAAAGLTYVVWAVIMLDSPSNLVDQSFLGFFLDLLVGTFGWSYTNGPGLLGIVLSDAWFLIALGIVCFRQSFKYYEQI